MIKELKSYLYKKIGVYFNSHYICGYLASFDKLYIYLHGDNNGSLYRQIVKINDISSVVLWDMSTEAVDVAQVLRKLG